MTTADGSAPHEVRAERLSPAELDAAIEGYPLAYLPLGSLEFHGPHLPIGLDGLTAHGVCVRAAARTGGIVLPIVYQGIGGGHVGYPWTVMMDDGDGVREHLLRTLTRLETFGVRGALLFSGHFAGEQIELIDTLAAEWNAVAGRSLHVLATSVARCPTSPIPPDHAGLFEASLLHALEPGLVRIDRLPATPDPGGDPWGEQRHDPGHPLWGIFGADPRHLDHQRGVELLDALVDWVAGIVR